MSDNPLGRANVRRALAGDSEATYACVRCGATYVAGIKRPDCRDCGGELLDASGQAVSVSQVMREPDDDDDDDHHDISTPLVPSLGVFESLYDFGFTSLITPKLIKGFYALAVLLLSVLAIAGVMTVINIGYPIALIGIAFWYVFLMFVSRIWSEYFIHEYLTGEHVYAIWKELEAARMDRRSSRR